MVKRDSVDKAPTWLGVYAIVYVCLWVVVIALCSGCQHIHDASATAKVLFAVLMLPPCWMLFFISVLALSPRDDGNIHDWM